ncbi:hypothetical protein H0I76_12335 [Limibaculum sp. M0105]|uniref:Capsular polysaccharide transport system permease protein n=1 Tax=Thermohalobaculum xanthum TaxID=2753746 RepID=A0A8J7M7Z2_9RHOB|nr:hypothetical protein [Thermohalobaculum xanthum]MBK0399981.1 hypothetical protein [Thermohalobaculum xanthum]
MKAERAGSILPHRVLRPQGGDPRRRSLFWPAVGFAAFVLLPTLLAAAYYYLIAADRYVTEFRYAVRGGAASLGNETDQVAVSMGSGAALQAAADSFILEDYLRSYAAVSDVERTLPLRDMLGRDGGDPIRRYNVNLPPEEIIDFWNGALDVRFDVVTGITSVSVALYTPEDSAAVARALAEELGILVDKLSEQAREEMLAYVEGEFVVAEQRLRESLDAIEEFRRENELVSPTETAELGSTVIATLTSEVTELRVRLRSLMVNVPNSPQIPVLTDRIASLEAQLAAERAALGGRSADSALPGQLSLFERLQNEYLIARDIYISTLELRQKARSNATLSMAQLVVFVPPRPAVWSIEPVRWLEVLIVFSAAFLVWLIGRILLASLRTP